jgi:hypothetical protein
MNIKTSFILTLSLVLAVSTIAESKDKKKHAPRGMVESMQSVPCGAKERGLAGLGSVFGSVGVQHVNSHEQLCTQYLFRTDEMEYHIRPLDTKHAALLPVGHEGEFKIKKDRMYLKAVDGEKKARPYQVVSMQPLNSESKAESTTSRSEKREEYRPVNREGDRAGGDNREGDKTSDDNRERDTARGDSREGDKTTDPPPQH